MVVAEKAGLRPLPTRSASERPRDGAFNRGRSLAFRVTKLNPCACLLCRILLVVSCIAPAAKGSDIFADPSLEDLPALMERLTDPNVRLGASHAIVRIGKPAVPRLIEKLHAGDVDVRIWSAYTLGQIGPDASSATSGLARALVDTDKNVRAVAARSLGQIRAAAARVIDALAKSTSDTDPRVRKWSVISLGQIGPAAGAAVPQLIDALDDQPIRADAIESLVQIGDSAIPLLTDALVDSNVRLEAAEAIRKIDPVEAKRLGVEKPSSDDLAALGKSLLNAEKDIGARREAAKWLGSLGLEAAPILITAFADQQGEVVEASVAAFAAIGPPAVPLLKDALGHESAQVRAATVDAFAAIGPAAEDATADLITAVTDDDRNVRHRAVRALHLLGQPSEAVIRALIAVMQNPRDLEATRQLAIKALAGIAPPGHEDTIAALRESTQDKNYGVSSLAKQMLQSLEAD